MATDFTPVSRLLEEGQTEVLSAVAAMRQDVAGWLAERDAKLAAQATELEALRRRLDDGEIAVPVIDPRDTNFPIGIAAVKEWCAAHGGVAPWSRIYRLAAGVLTESYGGYRLANAGAAYPDTGITPWASATMTLATRQAARAELAKSTKLPNDRHPTKGYTTNGASVGWLQQIPLALTRILFGQNWGYGTSVETSVADCLDVRMSTLMFCDRLQVTTRTSYTASDGAVINGLDPIMADLLALQQPLATEARKTEQYGPNMLVKVKHMVDNWGPRYFTDMAPPPILAN